MYRIELKPGEETVFRTIEELAIGIRNGLVTPRARIFHNASQKWLPIEFHPHYKKALTLPATKSGETPAVAMPLRPPPAPPVHAAVPAQVHVRPLPAPPSAPTGGLTFIEVPPEPEPVAAEAPAPVPAMTSPVVDLPTISYTEPHAEESAQPVAHAPLSRSPLHRPKAFRLGLAAALLIAGAYIVLSAAKPAPTAAATPPAPTARVLPLAAPAVEQPALIEQAVATPSTSGPTFGGPPAPVVSKRSITASIGSNPVTLAAKTDSTTIEPPPADVDLSVPSLPKGESLAPIVTNDSNAIRRILRAVGGKAEP